MLYRLKAPHYKGLRKPNDALGRLITLTHSIVALTPMVTFTQAYDAAGRRTELKTQINGTAEFVNQWTYDPLGRVVRITQGPQPGGRAVAEKRVDFSYDAAGQLTALARYADLSGTQLVAESSYTYDQAGRLRNLRHFQGQTTFVEHTWNFDAAGRMTQYVNSVDGTADYTSDAAGQLTAADYDYQTDESYEYDSNGNRVLANGSTYTTGANNRLLSDGTHRYLYDAEGNRTHRFIDANQNGQLDSGDTDITQYTWDHRNRLVKVEHRPGYAAAVDKVVEYFYDYQNRWVRKAIDSDGDGHLDGRRIFLYDGNQIVMDFRRANSEDMQIGHLRQRYLWGPAVDQILAEEAVDGGTPDLVAWTLTDHLNTVRDIARFDPQTGATTVVNHLVYDAFGRVTSETNPAVDSLFLFTARPFDEDTQLQNNLNRWYDASVGRWLSEDPVGFDGGDGNLYRYVGNRPVQVIDPDGHQCVRSSIAPTLLNLTRPRASAGGLEVSVGMNPGTFDQKPIRVLRCTQERTLGVLYDCCCGWGPWGTTFTTSFIIRQERSARVRTDPDFFMVIGVGAPLPSVGGGPGITIWWYQLAPGEQQRADIQCHGAGVAWGAWSPPVPATQSCPQ